MTLFTLSVQNEISADYSNLGIRVASAMSIGEYSVWIKSNVADKVSWPIAILQIMYCSPC